MTFVEEFEESESELCRDKDQQVRCHSILVGE